MASSVREATFHLLRELGLTTVFGNPGSTEETFLKDFPSDFTYVQTPGDTSMATLAEVEALMRGGGARIAR